MATTKERKAALEKVLAYATQMSNICFNLSQSGSQPLTERSQFIMREAQRNYDLALSNYRGMYK